MSRDLEKLTQQIDRLASVLESQGKTDAPISLHPDQYSRILKAENDYRQTRGLPPLGRPSPYRGHPVRLYAGD